MRQRLALFLFIDALGWELLQYHRPGYLMDLVPERKALKTILGYSSACDPSIISGKLPAEHGLWSSYYYSPQTSPFRRLWWLPWLPAFLTQNHRIRHILSRWVAEQLGFSGYFQLYQMPLDLLSNFDYAEQRWIYGPGGMEGCETLFDLAVKRGVPYHVSALEGGDQGHLQAVLREIERGEIAFAYVTLGNLDALMHRLGPHHSEVGLQLDRYEAAIRVLVQTARRHYRQLDLAVFSDHGMHVVVRTEDLMTQVARLGYQYGTDYVAVYDSTMARFWFKNDEARQAIKGFLKKRSTGSVLENDELRRLGVYFFDGKYGELIYLLSPGGLIVPSFMGAKRIPGMHGYHPDSPDSYATLLTNASIDPEIKVIHQLFPLLQRLALTHSH